MERRCNSGPLGRSKHSQMLMMLQFTDLTFIKPWSSLWKRSLHISLYKESFINFETSSLPLFARISVLMDVVITVSNVFSSIKPKFQTCHSIFAKNAKERICTKSIGQRYLQISSVYKMQQRIWGQGGGDMSPLQLQDPYNSPGVLLKYQL